MDRLTVLMEHKVDLHSANRATVLTWRPVRSIYDHCSSPDHTRTTTPTHRLHPARSAPAPTLSTDLCGRSSAGERQCSKACTGWGSLLAWASAGGSSAPAART